MRESDIAYIAGLFDGEGCVSYKQVMKRRGKHPAYKTWDIRMEISMTEKSIIHWVHEVLKVGTFSKKPPGKVNLVKKCNTDGVVVGEMLIMYVVYYTHMLMLS